MKANEELNAIKEEVESVNKKLQELTPEELEQVSGGACSQNDARQGVAIYFKQTATITNDIQFLGTSE